MLKKITNDLIIYESIFQVLITTNFVEMLLKLGYIHE